jgi:hypothetical protein
MLAKPAVSVLDAGSNIVQLRQLLAQKFPRLRQALGVLNNLETVSTGVATLDQLLGGGFPRGAVTELVARGHGSGSAEVIHAWLRRLGAHRQYLALVDGLGSFDPAPVEPAVLSRLLWVRCRQATEALKAADLLLRDRNFSFLAVDLKLNPLRELKKISSSIWFRFARLIEQNRTTVLVITPQALVSVANCRVQIESALGMESLWQPGSEVLRRLRCRLVRSVSEPETELAAQAG